MPPISDATKWRTNPYVSIPYLYLDNPPIVFQAQINQAVTFPVDNFTYNNVTVGAYTDVKQFQTVIFGSAPGLDDQGRGYVRKTPTTTVFYPNRSSQGTTDGTLNVASGSYITVLDQWRPFARIPFIADGTTVVNGSTPAIGTQFRDWDLDYTVGINGSPVINIGYGSGYAAYVDPNTNVITVPFTAVSGYSYGTDANIVSWSVDIADGTVVSGTTPNITVTFPPGRRYIHFTGFDSNGNSTTRHLLVAALKDGTLTPIKQFDVSKHELSLNSGSSFSIRIRENIPRSTYPDQCNVVYFKREFYNSVEGSLNVVGSFGATGSESIKFSGWHFDDENITNVTNNGYINEVTLNCLDTLGWLDKLPGFSIEVDRLTAPTSWSTLKSANMDKYFLYILYYFSTALFSTDFYKTNTGDQYAFSRLGSGEATLHKQIQELADRAIGYEFTSNEQGMMYIRPNQNLLYSGNRTNVSIITLTEKDIASLRFLHTRFPKQHWNRGAFVLASTADITSITYPQTSFWVAPGKAPGQGAQSVDYNEQLAIAASEGQSRTANRYAEDNSDFSDIEIVTIWPGDAGIDPAYGQWITLDVSATYTAQRGLPFTNARLRVISVSWQEQSIPQGHVSTQKIIGRIETNGTAAVDDTPPVSNVALPPPSAPPPAPISIGNIGGVTHDGGTVVAMSLNQIGICVNYRSSAAQTWSSRLGSGLPSTDVFLYMILDPYSDSLIKKIGNLGAWIITRHGLYYTNNILAATGTIWTKQQTLNIREGIIRASTTAKGVVYMAHCGNSSGSSGPTQAKKLSAYGATVDWSVQCGSDDLRMTGADIDQYGSDEMLTSGRVGNTAYVYRVIGGTATQLTSTASSCSAPETQGIWFIQKPLKTYAGANNSSISSSEIFLYNDVGNSKLYSTSNGGSSITDISPSGGVKSYYYTSSIAFTTNSGILAIPNLTNGHMFTSSNAGVAWTDNGGGFLYTSGYYPNVIDGNYALYGGGLILIYSPDFSISQIDKTGNWTSSIGAISGFFSVIPIY